MTMCSAWPRRLAKKVLDPERAQELGGIPRYGARGEDLQTRHFRGLEHVLDRQLVGAGEVGQARDVLQAEHDVDTREPQVGVDEDHVAPALRVRHGQVRGDDGLPSCAAELVTTMV